MTVTVLMNNTTEKLEVRGPRVDETGSISQFKQNEKIGALLKNVPLLSKLTDHERALIGGAMLEKKFTDQQIIIQQGDPGLAFYVIHSGEVAISRRSDTGEVIPMATLKAGDFFGETALLSNTPRTATVHAVGEVHVFYLERPAFNTLFTSDRLNVQFAKRHAVAAERLDTKYVSKVPSNAVKEKSAATAQLLLAAMKDNVLFMNLDHEHKAQILTEMYRCEIKQGINAIIQGELGDNLYIVESGEFDVFVNGKMVAKRGKGTCFGELALMYNSPRAATVTAATDSVVWVVDRFTFRRIVSDVSERKFALYVSFLKKVELLSPLAEYERKKIAEALEEVALNVGQVVFKQGDEGDAMYIVYSGEVRIVKKETGMTETMELDRVVTGGYFGERALITNEPRAASSVAATPVQLLKLDRNAFALLLGPLEDIMKRRVQSYATSSLRTPIPPVVVIDRPKIAWEDLKVVKTLGKGSFGFVRLVQDRKTGTAYALKAVSKTQIVQTGQQGHVMSEKRAMMLIQHPFCIQLFATYKDKDRLYFLLEPSLGGELFTLLREKTLFDEDTARFYAACVVSAFEYMHDLNLIYRDLKPENLLLDKDGYIKVTDFGFAKDISAGRTWTLCGTPDYLAPEIVAGKGHGKGVDWWTLGIFIYEMLASYPPFYDEDPMKTYQKIMQGNIAFPSHFSKEAVSIIKKLLQPKATKRLGCLSGGARDIKAHPFFKAIDWDVLKARKMRSPYIPKIKSNLDTSNFEDYGDQEKQVEPYVDDGSNWDAEF